LAISKTIFAAGNDDLRPVMSGVFFNSHRRFNFVAQSTNWKVCSNDVAVASLILLCKKTIEHLKIF
jgi:hypothetical protein